MTPRRLFWTLQGPLEESVSVMRDRYSPDSHLEPYYLKTVEGDTWHAISEKPMTVPPVSNLFADVYDLKWWRDDWLEQQYECRYGDRVLEDSEGNVTTDEEMKKAIRIYRSTVADRKYPQSRFRSRCALRSNLS